MKVKILILILYIVLCKFELSAQYLLYNSIDTFYLFKKYSYHLNLKEKDTSLFYLKLDLKTTDFEKTSSQSYKGEYEYAQFSIDNKKRQIHAILFDSNKQKLKTELYSFIPKVIKTTETYFFNLEGAQKLLTWNTIETFLIE